MKNIYIHKGYLSAYRKQSWVDREAYVRSHSHGSDKADTYGYVKINHGIYLRLFDVYSQRLYEMYCLNQCNPYCENFRVFNVGSMQSFFANSDILFEGNIRKIQQGIATLKEFGIDIEFEKIDKNYVFKFNN